MLNLNEIQILEEKSLVTFNDINCLTENVGWGSCYYDSPEHWAKTLASSSHIAFIKINQQLVAFGRLVEDGQMCMFYDICVHSQYQQQGFGTLILNYLIDKIKDKNYVSIGLFVWHGNAGAHQFYSKFGFESVPAMELKRYMKKV